MKKILIIIFTIVLIFFNCKEKEYKVDFDEDEIEIKIQNNILYIKNNSNYPVLLNEILLNKKSFKSFIDFKKCNFIKSHNEVILNLNDSNNQIIYLNSILLPNRDKGIILENNIEKGDKFRVILYPLNYKFISDNIYFEFKKYSDNDIGFKNFKPEELKNLDLPFITNKNTNEIGGIMIYTSEFNKLEDFVEVIDYKY